MDELHEECGIFGVFSLKREKVSLLTYYGLFALQHRGQESCGISVFDGGSFRTYKDVGLVNEVLTDKTIEMLGSGTMAVGHVRYGTTGNSSRVNAQPIEVKHIRGRLATVHNGNIVNASELREALELEEPFFHTPPAIPK